MIAIIVPFHEGFGPFEPYPRIITLSPLPYARMTSFGLSRVKETGEALIA